jgi:hypothetical protein
MAEELPSHTTYVCLFTHHHKRANLTRGALFAFSVFLSGADSIVPSARVLEYLQRKQCCNKVLFYEKFHHAEFLAHPEVQVQQYLSDQRLFSGCLSMSVSDSGDVIRTKSLAA